MTHKPQVDPTCTEKGTEAYWECTDCKKLFADANGETPLEAPKEIPAVGHDWGDWTVTKEPTETAEGEKVRICKRNADHKETDKIPAKGKTPSKEYVITYNLNGGTWDGKTGTVQITYTEGTSIKLPSPTRAGYTFDYWEGSRYEAGASYTIYENHTFTAVWKVQEQKTPDRPTPHTGETTHLMTWVTVLSISMLLLPLLLYFKRRVW